MSQYYLFLYDNAEAWAQASPEDMQQALGKYMAWAQKPFLVSSQRLAEEPGKVIRAVSGKPVATDGPYSETKETLGGYYLIEAKDYDEAVQLSLDHPHLEYGGTIEVRKAWEE